MASNGVDISSLKAIYIFQNINNHRIIQSIDIHKFENGEIYGVQRSYLLLMDGKLKVVNPNYFSRIEGCDFSKIVLGKSFGAWLCTYTIGVDHPPNWLHIPSQFTCLSYGHLQAITRLPTRDTTPPSCIIHEGVNIYYENPFSFSRSNDIHASESAQHRGTNWCRFSQGENCPFHNMQGTYASESTQYRGTNWCCFSQEGSGSFHNMQGTYASESAQDRGSNWCRFSQGPNGFVHNIQGTYAAQASSSQNRDIGSSGIGAYEQINENAMQNEHNAYNSNAPGYQMRFDLNFPPLDDPAYIEVDYLSGEITEPIPVRKQRPPIGYIDSLTVEDFRRYFHLNRVDAAAALDISYTSLQKKRAKLGIRNWPYIKLRTLDNLSRKLQEEAERGNANRLPGSMNVHQWQERLTREKEEIRDNPAREIPRDIIRLQKLIAQRRRARAMKAAAAAAGSES